MKLKKEDSRPEFRSLAKIQTYDYFTLELQRARRKLKDNIWSLQRLAQENSQLKADISNLHRLMSELKKK